MLLSSPVELQETPAADRFERAVSTEVSEGWCEHSQTSIVITPTAAPTDPLHFQTSGDPE
jgi:hypothetical protein